MVFFVIMSRRNSRIKKGKNLPWEFCLCFDERIKFKFRKDDIPSMHLSEIHRGIGKVKMWNFDEQKCFTKDTNIEVGKVELK